MGLSVAKEPRKLLYPQDSGASYDYIHYDSDPTPDNYDGDEPDSHGTMCAGVIGMAKSNRYCGVGVAHGSSIGGTAQMVTITGSPYKINQDGSPDAIVCCVLAFQRTKTLLAIVAMSRCLVDVMDHDL